MKVRIKSVLLRKVILQIIREYENGWTIFNQRNTKQVVSFDNSVKGVNRGMLQSTREIRQLDGEIFCKMVMQRYS